MRASFVRSCFALLALTLFAGKFVLAADVLNDAPFFPNIAAQLANVGDEYDEGYVIVPVDMTATPPSDVFAPRRGSGFLAACLGDELVYRGQSASLTPSAESSTSHSTITSSAVSSATSTVPPPPATMGGSDPTFDPTPISTTNGEPTTFQKLFKNSQEVSGSYMFIPSGSKNGLGVHELEGRILFAIPCNTMRNVNNTNNGYFLLTPSFKYDALRVSKDLETSMDDSLKNVFDAGLTTTFLANFNDLEGRVDVSVGLGSSFKKVTGKAIYVRGRAEIGLPIDNEKNVKLFGGVEYLDTIKYKLVPVVGVTYAPNNQNILRIAYPNPRWDHYLTKVNETDWWLFVNGDLNSNRWLVHSNTAQVNGANTFNVDYSDYRLGIGVMFDCPSRLRGSFEVGGSFSREMRSKLGEFYSPKNAVYLKVGLCY